jgi:cytochrome c oxidase assembly factor CtaG
VVRPTQRFVVVTKCNALVVLLVLAMPMTLMLTLMPETRRQMWLDKIVRRHAASRKIP